MKVKEKYYKGTVDNTLKYLLKNEQRRFNSGFYFEDVAELIKEAGYTARVYSKKTGFFNIKFKTADDSLIVTARSEIFVDFDNMDFCENWFNETIVKSPSPEDFKFYIDKNDEVCISTFSRFLSAEVSETEIEFITNKIIKTVESLKISFSNAVFDYEERLRKTDF